MFETFLLPTFFFQQQAAISLAKCYNSSENRNEKIVVFKFVTTTKFHMKKSDGNPFVLNAKKYL